MATTPNYGFIMPDPTDLVTDLPADFEIFGDEVDSRIKALNPETTEGDLAYRGATADAKDRLGIGTAGQVLAVNSGATAPEWITAGGVPATNFTLLNAGGTALTGAATITVSISAHNKLYIYVDQASSASANSFIRVRFNGDSTTKYDNIGLVRNGTSVDGMFGGAAPSATSLEFARIGTSAVGIVAGYMLVDGANSSGLKTTTINTHADASSNFMPQGAGSYVGTSAITSVSLVSSIGNFDAGTIYIYGA